jgi:hypothetical protein
MSGEIFQLTFTASLRFDFRVIEPQEEEELAARSRKVFGIAKITGFLVTKWPRQFYHLEGNEQDVMAVFGRVQRDPRVYGIVLANRGFTDRRAFAQWNFTLDIQRSDTANQPALPFAEMPEDLASQFRAFFEN